MPDELNEVRPGDRITADLVNTLIRRVKAPSTSGEGTITVPSLFGLALPLARDAVLNAGLAVGKVLDAYGRELDSTQITPQPPVAISQVPAAGVRVNANQVILIAVSAQPTAPGEQPAPGPTIPDLMHKSLTEAQTLLGQRGIQSDQIDVLDVFGRPVGLTDPHKNDRRVISQIPLPGAPVSQTFAVKLVTTEVSGPLMPVLVGQTLVDARARLVQANILADLSALDVTGKPVDPSDSKFNGRLVINQVPPPGPQTKVITTVNLVTTMDVPPIGPAVPNLIHLDLASTKTALQTAAISMAWVLVRDVFGALVDPGDSQNNDRRVLNQSPSAGAPVREGMSMHLVATGRPATSTPGGGGTPTPTPVAPQISSITPLVAPLGSEIEIRGTNFDSNPANNFVTINGIAVVSAPSSTSELIRVTIPPTITDPPKAGEVKQVTIIVKTSGGTANSNLLVSPSQPVPTISFIQPSPTPIGSEIIITGANFDPDFTKNIVKIGGAAAQVLISSTTGTLRVVVPTGIDGGPPASGQNKSVSLTVQTAGGVASFTLAVSAAQAYPNPIIYEISPPQGARNNSVLLRTNITNSMGNLYSHYAQIFFYESTNNNPFDNTYISNNNNTSPFDANGCISVTLPYSIPGLGPTSTPVNIFIKLRVNPNIGSYLESLFFPYTVHYGSSSQGLTGEEKPAVTGGPEEPKPQ